jgi:hypothetical protein
MNLAEIALWGMGQLLSPDDRLVPVAHAIAEAAEVSPVFSGDAGEAATAIMLTSIARHESDLFESTRRCRRNGDFGRSIGLFQVKQGPFGWQGHAREDICASDQLQARLAVRILSAHRERCRACGHAFLLRAYATGDGGTESKASTDTIAIFERLTRKAGIVVDGGRAVWR